MGRVFFKGFPDANASIEEIIAAGDRVIIRWILRATHKS
jgi:predicted ester cyclase